MRWKRELERETRRTRTEFERWSEMQQQLFQENTRKRMANEEAVQKFNDEHRSKCKKKAVKIDRFNFGDQGQSIFCRGSTCIFRLDFPSKMLIREIWQISAGIQRLQQFVSF